MVELPLADWRGGVDPATAEAAMDLLESGRVVALPRLGFAVRAEELPLLSAAKLDSGRKNISLDSRDGRLKGATSEAEPLADMMRRFAQSATGLARTLLPAYAPHLRIGRTSFRPAEIAGRAYAPRKDDRRLHVDAFPTRPTQGERILRLFSNVAPDGRAREWKVGEPFPDVAARFLPTLPPPAMARARLYSLLGLTRGVRSPYDQLMLALHDRMKLDSGYQSAAVSTACSFPAASTWICFTDQVSHAALSGHFALEQTFHLPVAALRSPATAPLRVLERLAGRALA